MSLIASGYRVETKPDSPRTDIVKGSNGDVQADSRYVFKMYNGDMETKIGAFGISIVIASDLITRHQPKPQVLFTAMQNLRDFLKESRDAITTDPVEPRGVIFAIDPIVGKSSIQSVPPLNPLKGVELDLLAGHVHLVFIVQPSVGAAVMWSDVVIFNTITRLMEMCREKNYFWQDEVIRGLAPVGGGEIPIAQEINITAPTWTGLQPDIAYWTLDGNALVPHQDGLADLVIIGNANSGGLYQVKAGIKIDDVTTTAQWRTSEGVEVVISSATFIVTEDNAVVESEIGELLITEDS